MQGGTTKSIEIYLQISDEILFIQNPISGATSWDVPSYRGVPGEFFLETLNQPWLIKEIIKMTIKNL